MQSPLIRINYQVFLLIAAFVMACGENEIKSDKMAEIQAPVHLPASKHSDAFNQSFEKFLNAYFSVKTALVEYDTSGANAASKQLALLSDSLLPDEVTRDSSKEAGKSVLRLAGIIKGSSTTLVKAPDLEEKKKRFQKISDAVYELARTVKYDRQKLYHQRCPMAFDGETEAYWVSNSPEIVNPYLGKKHPKYRETMLSCGEVTDSLNF